MEDGVKIRITNRWFQERKGREGLGKLEKIQTESPEKEVDKPHK